MALVNIDMHGHVYPTLGPTQELVRRGHEVFFLGSAEYQSLVAGTGAQFRPYKTTIGATTAAFAKAQAEATARGVPPPREVSALARFRQEYSQTFGPLYQELTDIRPDVVIHTFATFAPKVIADHLRVPAVKLFTTYASNSHYNLMRETFAKHDFPTEAEMMDTETLLREVSGRYGCKAPSLGKAMEAIDPHNIVLMPRSFQPCGETFDERFHFVGPCVRAAQPLVAADLIPEGSGPLMIIALGSLFHEWPEFYQAAFQAFGGTTWRVIMAIGKKLRVEDLGPVPANFSIQAQIPQVELLPHADLFVSHGGMNSTMESLAFGVPLVVIPQIEEQDVTARRVAAMGLGRHLDRGAVNTQTLADAVRGVHGDQECHRRVHAMKEEIEASGGAARAATVIEQVATSTPTARHTSKNVNKELL